MGLQGLLRSSELWGKGPSFVQNPSCDKRYYSEYIEVCDQMVTSASSEKNDLQKPPQLSNLEK